MAAFKILLAEDHQSWQKLLQGNIRKALEFSCHTSTIQVANTFQEAWEALNQEGTWHLLVTDIGLGASESQQKLGRHLVSLAYQMGVPSIVVSGTPVLTPPDVRNLLKKYGAQDFFSKLNFESEEFIKKVQEILQVVIESSEELTSKTLSSDTVVEGHDTKPDHGDGKIHREYERGIQALIQLLKGTEVYQNFLTHEASLRDNLYQERRYGPTEQSRSDRARIVEQLNQIALASTGMSFNDLCRDKTVRNHGS